MPIGNGVVKASDVNDELGRSSNSAFSMNNSGVRSVASKPTINSGIAFSDFRGKRATPAYALIGTAATVTQRDPYWDSGEHTFTWNNVPRDSRIRSRVWGGDIRSHNHRYPVGYVFLRWRIYSKSGTLLYDVTKWNRETYQKDGCNPIDNWSEWNYIRNLVGSSTENVKVVITKRLRCGSYKAHIWGGRHVINRICGIESEVGY